MGYCAILSVLRFTRTSLQIKSSTPHFFSYIIIRRSPGEQNHRFRTMKSIGLFPTLAIMMTIVFVSCGKLEDRINSLEQRISELEDTRIPSIDEQVTSIKKTIIELEKTDSGLQGYISSLEERSSVLEKASYVSVSFFSAHLKVDCVYDKIDR